MKQKSSTARLLFTLLLGGIFSGSIHAAEVSLDGYVDRIRYHAAAYPRDDIKRVMTFQMDMGGQCGWYWLEAGDDVGARTALTAKTLFMPISINYDNDVGSPWGDRDVCRVRTIDLL